MKVADLSRVNQESRVKMIEWCSETFGVGNVYGVDYHSRLASWSTNLSMSRLVFWEDAEYEIFLLRWS